MAGSTGRRVGQGSCYCCAAGACKCIFSCHQFVCHGRAHPTLAAGAAPSDSEDSYDEDDVFGRFARRGHGSHERTNVRMQVSAQRACEQQMGRVASFRGNGNGFTSSPCPPFAPDTQGKAKAF